MIPLVQPCPCCQEFGIYNNLGRRTVNCLACSTEFSPTYRFVEYRITGKSLLRLGSEYFDGEDIETRDRLLVQLLPPGNTIGDDAERVLGERAVRVQECIHPNLVPLVSHAFAFDNCCLGWERESRIELSEMLKGGRRIAEKQILDWIIQLAGGLSHAHQSGLIHGRILPADIRFLDPNTPRLCGVGFFYPPEISLEEVDDLSYLAPETLQGTADFRADIFGLGAILFHGLVGYPPHRLNGAHDLAEITKVKQRTPWIPETIPPINPGLAQILRCMLEANPFRRFSGYEELLDALHKVSRNQGFTVSRPAELPQRKPTWVEPVSGTAGRNGKVWIAAVAGVLCLVIFLVALLIKVNGEQKQTTVQNIAPLETKSPAQSPTAAMPFLSTVVEPGSGGHNLSAEGTVDWIRWGRNSAETDRKVDGGSRITEWNAVGNGGVNRTSGGSLKFSWGDGKPTLSSTGNDRFIRMGGKNNGFAFRITAEGGAARELRLYCGTQYDATGRLEVAFEDQSAPPFVKTFKGGALKEHVVVVAYKAANPTRLSVRWTNETKYGNVTLKAAALK